MTENKDLKILINFYDVNDEKITLKRTIKLDNKNKDFGHIKSTGSFKLPDLLKNCE